LNAEPREPRPRPIANLETARRRNGKRDFRAIDFDAVIARSLRRLE
jgi:hypothetical protein